MSVTAHGMRARVWVVITSSMISLVTSGTSAVTAMPPSEAPKESRKLRR